jgi:hypothetical protein
MTQGFDPLSAGDLETNRGGRLTDRQRKVYKAKERSFRWNELVGGVMSGVLGAILLTATGPAPNAQYRPLAGAAFAVVGAFFVVRGLFLGDSLSSDLRSGSVETVEGAITKSTMSAKTTTFHYFEVAGRRFEVGSAAYQLAPEAGYVRLYFLPRSHKVVNMERLPDKPVPEGVFESPTAAFGVAMAALRGHDSVQRAEARAELASIANAIGPHPGAPPPPDQRDPRPLAEAILGTWQTGMISMTFMPDGTLVASLPGGRQRTGSWSIGPDGRLHSNATGDDQPADAWVAGDTLSISENGQAMAFHRAAAN